MHIPANDTTLPDHHYQQSHGIKLNKDICSKREQRVRMLDVVTILIILYFIGVSSVAHSTRVFTSGGHAYNEQRFLAVSEEQQQPQQHDALSSSCTDYRSYPWPQDRSGLPYLADVFTTQEGDYVTFIGINRGGCLHKYKTSKQDDFAQHDSHGYRFMCMFNGNIPVISEFVAPSAKAFRYNFVFRCKVPEQVQHQVQPGQATTQLHVDLHALHDLEQPTTEQYKIQQFPSQAISDLPKIPNIPVCHPSTSTTGERGTTQTYNLTAYTRLKSSYLLNHYITFKNETVSSNYRVKEWIAYHQTQGFDHFVIYDNDEQPHGPLESLLQPYIESGLVTYRWFPLKDCISDHPDSRRGMFSPWAQAAASVAALHRMGTRTRFFASMDVDEYLVLYNGQTVSQFMAGVDDKYDGVEFKPTIVEYCNGDEVVDLQASPLASRKCLTEIHRSDVKLIMRPDRMLLFEVHYALLTKTWSKPKMLHVEPPLGFLAHYRGEPPLGEFKRKYPSGKRTFPFEHMENFVATHNTSNPSER
ncbi:Pfam:DUF23 [Seminavis robusta]|uniref:Pfam:DUF23 n=1 Tax=Seminavis robusta TaxID=568900 RepID=A0A9N8HFI7_9STRA|nr:Pfam:DUF23 [Seminavis robusta]|eukprot:Sro526_g160310.1 Pfam:DUF23 (528) ;mRNA; f:11232-12926